MLFAVWVLCVLLIDGLIECEPRVQRLLHMTSYFHNEANEMNPSSPLSGSKA